MSIEEDVKALREALAAGPTSGGWKFKFPSTVMVGSRRLCQATAAESLPIGADVARAQVNAAYIAACTPDRISRILAELEGARKEQGWLPIEKAPTGKEMFVVRAFNVCVESSGVKMYTTDPYAVWRQEDGSFARWPHNFPPTHFCRLPPAAIDASLSKGAQEGVSRGD